jgi:hypothetical protein
LAQFPGLPLVQAFELPNFIVAIAGEIHYKGTIRAGRRWFVAPRVGHKGLVAATRVSAMKRYTGQKALYEAISRSRAKAKRGSILDKLRALPAERDESAGEEEPLPLNEPVLTPDEARALAEVPPEPEVQEQAPPPAGEKPPGAPVTEPPPRVEKPEPPVFRPRHIERIGRPAPAKPVQPLLRPKAVQWNAGRIEISVPYHIGVAVLLAAFLVVLIAFRLGENHAAKPVQAAGPATPPVRPTPQNAALTDMSAPTPASETPPAAPRVVEPAPVPQVPSVQPEQGDHLIVLARSSEEKDFDPVIAYFAEHEIGLIALPLNDATRKTFAEYGFNPSSLPGGEGFLLVTKNRYENPNRAGTKGYEVLQKIKELGPLYKPPKGGKSFAPNNFGDAYGMNIVK